MSQVEQTGPHSTERLSLPEWQVQVLRLTAFPHPAVRFDRGMWWEEVCRGLPDSEVTERAKDMYTATGPFEGGRLRLRVQPGRIDWLLEATEQDFLGVPTIGDLPGSLDAFCELAARWFAVEGLPQLMRIAFGTVLLHPVADRETGYKQMQSYLNYVQLDPAGSSDFMYQINRPRDSQSGIPQLCVNRLSKWSVLTYQPAILHLGPQGIEPVSQPTAQYACRLELDVNTVADFHGRFEREQLQSVFNELVELGKEIVREGDIR
jgi:hypothetical protein